MYNIRLNYILLIAFAFLMQLLEKSKITLATDYILVKTHCCIATELWSTITRKIINISTTEKDLIRLRQEDSEFEGLSYTAKPPQNTKANTQS